MYKNIIYITGNNSHAISKEIKRWVKVFEMKYGKENIDRIALDDRTRFPVIRDNLLSSGLFSEKRLFIFSGGIEKKVKGDSTGLEEILEKIAKDIPEDHFLLFHHIGAKEEGLIGGYNEYSKQTTQGWLQKNAEVRKMNTIWDKDYWENEYPALETKEVQEILREYKDSDTKRDTNDKNPNLGHIVASSLEMLTLAKASGYEIADKSIIYSEGGYNIFNLTDAILSERYADAYEILNTLKEHMSTKELLPSLIGNLRNTLYVKYLISQGKTQSQINGLIRMHSFVLEKNISAKISFKKVGTIYSKLVSIDRAYKSGKGLHDNELGSILSIGLAILELKK